MRRVLIPALVGATLAVVPGAPATAEGTGTVTTLAGVGVLDTAPATQVLVTPTDAHMTEDGAYYLADPANARIRLVVGGDISTVAGSLPGYAGDGGPATEARLDDPHRLVLTDDGDVVVADRGNRRVRRIDAAAGTITTIAGNGEAGTATPNVPATTQPVTPDDVAYDAAHDRVLIADSAANRVYELGSNGKLGVVAGTGTAAALATPWSVAVAPDGALYVGGAADIRKVDGGTATVVAGGGSQDAPRTDGTAATAVAVAPVRSVAVHPDGTLYFGDQLAPAGELDSKVRTVGADGTLGSVLDPDCGVAPVEVHEVDLAGYVTITCGHVFWEHAEGVWTPLAGDRRDVLPVPDGTPAADAGFRPGGHGLGVVADGDGYVFGHGYALYRLAGGAVSRVAGTGDKGWSPDGTPALSAKLNPCRGVTLLTDGTPVWAEGTLVRGVVGGVLTTLAGGAPGQTTPNFTEGMPAGSFQMGSCAPIAAAPGGDLAFTNGSWLYRVDVSAGTVHQLTKTPCGSGVAGTVHGIASGGGTLAAWVGDALCTVDLMTGAGEVRYRDYVSHRGPLAVAPDGQVLFESTDGEAPFTRRLRVLAPDGAVTTLAEEGSAREPVTTLADTDYGYLAGLTVDSAGGVVWQDDHGWLRRLAPGWSVDPVPGVTGINGTVAYAGDTASVTLTWTPPATGYDGIDVVALPPAGFHAHRKMLPAGATGVTLTGLDAGLPYVFDVRPTRDVDAEMAPHHRLTDLTPTAAAPAERPGLYVYSAGAGRTAALVWTAPPGAAASEVRLDGEPVYAGTGTGTVVSGLTRGETYTVAVHAAGSATPTWTQTFDAGFAPRLVLTAGPGQAAWAPADVTYAWTVRGGATDVACTVHDEPVACDDHLTLTGLTLGMHLLDFRATGPFGPLPVLERTVYVDPYAPTARVVLPGAPVEVDGVADVWNQSADVHSGVASYGLRYRRVHYSGAAGPYAAPASWQQTAASAQQLRGLKSGYTYCFSGRATDVVGNTSGWSADRCASVPLDDRALTASAGWTPMNRFGAYAGTVSRTTEYGRTLTLTGVTAGRVVLRATKCPTCGVVGVYVGGALVSKLDLTAPTVQRHVTINQGWFGVRSGTVTLKTLSRGELVEVDALALSSERY
jgi:hypothetical protein